MSALKWSANRVHSEGDKLRYIFYDDKGIGSAEVLPTPEEALDLAWSLFEDVARVAPQLIGAPRVERRHYDLIERTLAEVKADVERAIEDFPRQLKKLDDEWRSVQTRRPVGNKEAKE